MTKPNRNGKETDSREALRPTGSLPRRRLWLFRLVAVVVVPALIFLLLESGLRIAGYGTPTNFTVEADRNGQTFRIDNRAFSRQFFPARIARPPEPLLFQPDKPPGTYRIFVLGASAAQGDPDAAFSFSRILQILLEDRYPGVRFEVHNTAITAINSHVVLEIARDCARWDPDLFVVYLGNNEVVGPFGAGTVFAPLTASRALIRASVRLGQLKTGQLLGDLVQRVAGDDGAPRTWQGMEMFLDRQVRRDDPRMEIVYRHFRENLEGICRIARDAGAPVLLSSVGVNAGDCAPLASSHRPDLDEPSRKSWDGLYAAGIHSAGAGEWSEAIRHFQAAASIDPTFADLHYRLAGAYRAEHQPEKAGEHFAAALEYDTLRFRADRRINEIIRETAEGAGEIGIHFVDGAQALSEASPDRIAGRQLFFEHVHLNFSGNYRLAREFLFRVAGLMPPRVKEKEDTSRVGLSEEECRDRLVYTAYDEHHAVSDMLARIGRPPFSSRLDNEAQQAYLKNRLDELAPGVSPHGCGKLLDRYRLALPKSGSDWRLRYNLARLLDACDQQAERAGELETLVATLPHYPLAWVQLGDARAALEKHEEALLAYRTALDLDPHNTALHADIGMAEERRGNSSAAGQHYELALGNHPSDSALLVKLAQHKAALGKHGDALGYYRRALTLDPESGEILSSLGFSLFQLGRFGEAATRYRQALQRLPEQAGAHNNLGNALVSLGRREEAIDFFERAVRLAPDNVVLRSNLARAQIAEGRLAEGTTSLKTILATEPDRAATRLDLADVLMQRSRFDEAVLELSRLRASDPDYPGLRAALGLALARSGDYERALPLLRGALEEDAGDVSAGLNLGNTLLALGRVEEAARQYERVLQIDSSHSRAHHNLAYSYLELKEWEKAVTHFQEYLRLNPDDARARDQLAVAQQRSQRP